MFGKTILLIDDDLDILQLTAWMFKKAGAETITAVDGQDGISKFLQHRPHLIILDIMMPGLSGFEVCQRIRQVSDTPIIMLTALNHENEMLRGLEAGADDFVSKPFNSNILLARARNVLRRTQRDLQATQPLEYNDGRMKIDFTGRYVMIQGESINLSPIEFRLLVYLVRNQGKVLSFEQILANVWGQEYRGSLDYVHVYISRLRSKIELDAKDPRYIRTVHRVGYTFEKPNPKSEA